jgi:hypothetical protein
VVEGFAIPEKAGGEARPVPKVEDMPIPYDGAGLVERIGCCTGGDEIPKFGNDGVVLGIVPLAAVG